MRLIPLILLAACISSCDNAPSHSSSDYLKRLANVLEVEVPSRKINVLEFPAARNLRLKQETATLSVREFLSLRECELHTTIAKRNSLIGKIANTSQILFSDIELIAQGPACLEIVPDPQLKIKLERFLIDKKANLPNMLAHALLEQKEHAEFWRLRDTTSNYPRLLQQETISNLNGLAKFARAALSNTNTFTQSDYDAVEKHLGQIRFGDGGRLLWEYAHLVDNLQQANLVIEQRVVSPLCLNQQPTQKARYFQNVVTDFFIAKVQTHAVLLNQRADALMDSHVQVESMLIGAASESYQRWAQARNKIIQQGKDATKNHVTFVQKLYQQCGLAAGNR